MNPCLLSALSIVATLVQSAPAQDGDRPWSAEGTIVQQRTWRNTEAGEPLGADRYVLDVNVVLHPQPQVTLVYRDTTIRVSGGGQSFQLRPYANTTATWQVRRFVVSTDGVAVEIAMSGITTNPSVVFSGGYRNAFSGSLTLRGTWDQNSLRIAVDEKQFFSGLGNTQWEGQANLPRPKPVPRPAAVAPEVVGAWQQYIRVGRVWRLVATVDLALVGQRAVISVRNLEAGCVAPERISDIATTGGQWSFRSHFADGRMAAFDLRRSSDGIYLGTLDMAGSRSDTLWIRVDEAPRK